MESMESIVLILVNTPPSIAGLLTLNPIFSIILRFKIFPLLFLGRTSSPTCATDGVVEALADGRDQLFTLPVLHLVITVSPILNPDGSVELFVDGKDQFSKLTLPFNIPVSLSFICPSEELGPVEARILL